MTKMLRRSRSAVLILSLVFALLLLGGFPAAWADLTITSAQLTGGGKPVIVNRSDGNTVRGTVTNCTPELLFVMPTPKPVPKNSNPPPATQPVEVPWKQIRYVSGGLTPRLAMDIWIAKNSSALCPTCHGERTVWCSVCKGTRHDPASATTCPTCHGELLIDCKTTGEKNGQIKCPNSCLKLGAGAWAKQPDGLMWRTWHFGRATQQFSEHHLGDVMLTDLKAPPQTPPISDEGKCPICGGTTKVDDAICFGTGKVPCPTCLARIAAALCPNHCNNGRVVCPTCGGTGLAKSAS